MTITTYLYIPFIVWFVAQGIKFILAYFRGDFDLRYLFASGGMPSVHSAVVSSMATVALIEGGPGSPLFGITGVFAAIVMYDSFGVRRSAGEQARTLNNLIDDLGECGSIRNADNYEKLRVILGHKPVEVAAGATLGVVLTALFESAKLGPQLAFLSTQPGSLIVKLTVVKAIAIFLLSAIFAWWVRYRAKNRKAWQSFARQLFYSSTIIAVVLGIAALCMFENVAYFDNWLTLGVVALASAALYVYLFATAGRSAYLARKEAVAETRQDKWLKKAKRTKRKS